MIVYTLIRCLLIPLEILRLVGLVVRGAETPADLCCRLIGARVTGPVIWLHGASLGELQSARQVIAGLAPARILVTATRKTAVDAVRGWGMPGVTAALAPLDLGPVTTRMLRANDIRLLITLENELWPARMLACHRADVPVVLLGARMSDRTAGVWARLPRLARAMLRPVQAVWPQNAASARHLVALGVPSDRIRATVKLKTAYLPPEVRMPPELAGWTRATTILAAATHQGEEEVVLAAFAQARRRNPDLRLIIAPRHADRGPQIAALLGKAGVAVRRRSQGDPPDMPVYLADTLGEMPLWYTLAGVAFVGGSLVPKGGHTPYEPAAHDCPILHGPYLANFAEDYAALDAAGAAKAVTPDSLAAAMLAHLDDRVMAQKARALVVPPDIPGLVRALSACQRRDRNQANPLGM